MAILKRKKDIIDIREVHFGIRLRILLFLSLIMVIVISVLAFSMYLNQRNLLEEEKNTKANVLTQILSGPAEFYLDKTIETTNEALRIKYDTITSAATSFENFNEDISKIILTDEKGKVRFSTNRRDYKRRKVFSYIKNCLNQENEELNIYDYSEPAKSKSRKKNKNTEKTKENKFRAITYPIFLHKGNVIDLLNDFKKYYHEFHKAGGKKRKQIYNILWKKYRNTLGKSFNPRRQVKRKGVSKKIVKAGDIDFLFLKLFSNIIILRDKRIKRSDRWMFRNKWLIKQKKKKRYAFLRDMPQKAKEINDRIISSIEKVSMQVENIRRLGALAIIFNVDKIQTELDQTIYRVLTIASIMTIICMIAFRFVLSFMIQNLKKLEKWAISVSAGNLDTKIVIKTNDEIGRLSDIFNKMIDEISIKYHLEKFVSSSAKSMIGKRPDTFDELELGGTDRRNLIFLFSDVRGFTSFSEKNDPSIVIEVLNFYLDLQANVIMSKKGDIDSFVGDEIMALFRGEKRIERAIEAAKEIMTAIEKVNKERLAEGLPIFEVGIGIHGGDVIVGNIGSQSRMDFTCIGDVVNLSARLCSNADAGEILISKEIYTKSKKKYNAINTAPINVKGKENKISIVKIKA